MQYFGCNEKGDEEDDWLYPPLKGTAQRRRERKKKLVVPGGEVSAAHGPLRSTKCTPLAVRNKPKVSFQFWKPFSALLCSFYMKMPPGFDKTAATATSTLNSLVEANVQLAARFLCFFSGFLWVLKAACSSCSQLSSQLKRS